jgi:heme-degrading monooxygenase HmoA
MLISRTPPPPYYAVIFTSLRMPGDEGYGQTAEEMAALAAQQPGFLGMDSARGEDGVGITVAYWSTREAIAAWKRHADHWTAQRLGREKWYRAYEVRVARVERAYGFERD